MITDYSYASKFEAHNVHNGVACIRFMYSTVHMCHVYLLNNSGK